MKAIRVTKIGGPAALELVEMPTPTPKEDEVLVKIEAAGVNFIDTYHRTGLYPIELPSILGLEAAGTVLECGKAVAQFEPGAQLKPGDRVSWASAPLGAYAEFATMPAHRVIKLPEFLDAEAAAASMLKGMTVEYLIRRCYRVQPQEWVLLHAAAGGVGHIAAQWLSRLGARVIGTVGSVEKSRQAKAWGCEETILYRDENVAARVRDITNGEKVAVVFDGVGAATWTDSLDSLRPRGMLVSFGNASGSVPAFDLAELATRGALYVTRPSLFHYTSTREELTASAEALFAQIENGIDIKINQKYKLAQAQAAHELIESRRSSGSILLIN